MPPLALPTAFHPLGLSDAGLLTWVHIGDLHMVQADTQNHDDLLAIVRQLNASFAADQTEGGTAHASFVYLPGDNADHGDIPAYTVVREALDQLRLPWCAIVGDHDVHEKSHANFLAALSSRLTYSFTVGPVRFLALNAFDIPEPPSFTLREPQLAWIAEQLRKAHGAAQPTVLLLHCYPGDLKHGREALQQLIAQYRPLVVDMGHTHYNELSNDGHTLYTATRSTGQIEEGPVGFSVTTFDFGFTAPTPTHPTIAWRFFPLGPLEQGKPAVLITHPSDSRLVTQSTPAASQTIRAAIWSAASGAAAVTSVTATVANGTELPMHCIDNSNTWQCDLPKGFPTAPATITVTAFTVAGETGSDTIEYAAAAHAALPNTPPASASAHEDHYAAAAWPAHGLLGTQLGPNKNGRKW